MTNNAVGFHLPCVSSDAGSTCVKGIAYSQKMLMVPASKVSVPLTVVMRTRSRTPDSDLEPPTVNPVVPPVSPKIAEQTQLFEFMFVSTKEPEMTAAALPERIVKPVVYEVAPGDALMVAPTHKYPVALTDPSPIWSIGDEVPFVLTALSITVIRFAHDGMPVKSTLVPDALTAVPEISNVPFSLALLPTAAKAVAVILSPHLLVTAHCPRQAMPETLDNLLCKLGGTGHRHQYVRRFAVRLQPVEAF
jgi:hypothetical protein